MGVPFNRTPEGLLDFRRFGGTLFHRTAFAGATTGQQLLYALDEQVRRYESEGKGPPSTRAGSSSPPCSTARGACRGICALDPSAPWRPGRSRQKRSSCVPAAMKRNLLQVHQLRRLHRLLRGNPRSTRGASPRQRRVHPGPPHLHPRRRQASPMSRTARGEGGRDGFSNT